MHAAYFRPGGVHQDLPAGMLDSMEGWIKQFYPFMKDIESLPEREPHLPSADGRYRHRVGRPGARLGFSGPLIRASGLPWDLRKSQPYDVYDRMDFDIPVGKTGDCYARYLVRIEEMYQSTRIMEQCIAALRKVGGPVRVDDRKISPPRRGEMKDSMEALIHHFKLYTEGYKVPAGETYTAVEAPKGEFGGLSRVRRHQQALPLQDPRSRIPAPAGARDDDQGTPARRHVGEHRLARHRVRRDRPLGDDAMAMITADPKDVPQVASFSFTPEYMAKVEEQIAHYPPGRQASAVIAVLDLAQRQQGWLPRAAMNEVARLLEMGADPRLRDRDLLYDVPAAAEG